MFFKSIYQMLLIASNYDGSFSREAVEQATLRLTYTMDTDNIDFKLAWQEVLDIALEQNEMCHICRSPDIAYTEDIYFCTEEDKDIETNARIDLPDFIPEIYSEGGMGIMHSGGTSGYRYAKGKYRLCRDCLVSRRNKKTGKLQIPLKDYYEHPLVSYYETLGFNRIKTSLER